MQPLTNEERLKATLKEGDLVSVRTAVEAWYSNYAGQPRCVFEPGDVGVVDRVGIPYVTESKYRRRHTDSFVKIKFYKEGVLLGKYGDDAWEVGIAYDNIVVMPEGTPRYIYDLQKENPAEYERKQYDWHAFDRYLARQAAEAKESTNNE